MRPFGIAVLVVLVSGVASCVLPPAFTIASFVADGLSMASTGKTVTDQAISFLAHKDCRLWRLVQGKSICGSDANVVAVAALPPPLPLHAASPGLRPAEQSIAATTPSTPVPVVVVPLAPAAQTTTATPVAPTTAPLPAVAPSVPAVSTPAVAASIGAAPRQKIAQAPAAPSHQTAPATVAAAPPAEPSIRHTASDARVRGEMIIRSGTDEAEARALADSLHAVGAVVRPARHGDITIYEVVMGLSG
jgi:hypothetical protein